MSQTAKQNPAPKYAPMSELAPQEAPFTGLSPDDPIDVKVPDSQPADR